MPISDHRLVSVSSDGRARIWDLETGQCISTFGRYATSALGCALGSSDPSIDPSIHPDACDLVYVSTQDAKIHVHSIRDPQRRSSDGDEYMLATLKGHGWEVWQLLGSTQVQLFSAGFDHTVRRWDGRTGWRDSTVLEEGHRGYVHAMVSLDGQGMATGCADRTIKIWS